jgi:ankyrin repeat protein
LDDIARFCIAKGVDLEERDAGGRTILAHVARLGDVRTAKLLIDAKINLDARQGQEGWTALDMIASIPPLNTGANGIGKWQDLGEVAGLLLQAGASLSQTSLDLAQKNGNDKLLSIFQNSTQPPRTTPG